MYALIEDDILKKLDTIRKTSGVKTLKSYEGEFADDSIAIAVDIINFPAIMVLVGGMKNSPGNRTDSLDFEIKLYLADRTARGGNDARKGGYANPGVYTLLKNARNLIHKQAIAQRGAMVLQNEAIVGYSKSKGICVAEANYTCKMRG